MKLKHTSTTVILMVLVVIAKSQKSIQQSSSDQELLKLRQLYQYPTSKWDSLKCALFEQCAKPKIVITESRVTGCLLNKRVFGWYSPGDNYANFVWQNLSDLSYFSYDVDASTGSAINASQISNWQNDRGVNLAKSHNVNINLCVKLFQTSPSYAEFATFFGNARNQQQTLINNLIVAVIAANGKGINLDFEGVSLGTTYLSQFVSFVKSLSTQLHSSIPNSELSVDLMGSQWKSSSLINQLNPFVDLFIMMGYDYYTNGTSGSTCGPVAPLYSFNNTGSTSVSSDVNGYLGLISPKKFILAIPYYGRTWPTGQSSCFIPTTATGAGNTYSYSVFKDNSSGYFNDLHRDTYSYNPYFCYLFEGTTWKQAFNDDVASYQKKYDFILQKNIAGVAVWKLAFDDGYSDLWDLINKNLMNCSGSYTASLQSFSISPKTVSSCNNCFTISYSVNATSQMSIMLGASIRQHGTTTWIDDSGNDTKKSIPSGTTTQERSFCIPTTLAVGDYDVIVALWLDNNSNNQIDANDTQISTMTTNSLLTVNPCCTLPSYQATNIVFTNPQPNQLTLNWTNGTGSGRIVVIKAGSAITGSPANGVNYSASTSYGAGDQIASGEYVIYSGAVNGPVTVTNLNAGTIYYFRVFEYNCSGTDIIYKTTTAANNPNNQRTSDGCALVGQTPTLISPGTNSSPGQTIPTTTPTLSWTAVQGAGVYGVYIRDVVTNTLVYSQDCAANTNSLKVPSGILNNGGQYKWNMISLQDCGSSCKSNAPSVFYFNVNTSTCSSVNITTQPSPRTSSVGATATFSVAVNGTAPFDFYWYKNNSLIASHIGISNSTDNYTTPTLSSSDNGNTYYCIIKKLQQSESKAVQYSFTDN